MTIISMIDPKINRQGGLFYHFYLKKLLHRGTIIRIHFLTLDHQIIFHWYWGFF